MKEKNMYTLWRDKELPEQIQKQIDTRIDYCHSKDEKLFTAGFFAALKIKEIRKLMGMDDV